MRGSIDKPCGVRQDLFSKATRRLWQTEMVDDSCMIGAVTELGPADRFSEQYARRQGEVARRVERAVLGHEVGLNGFTTVEQAETLCDSLPVTSGCRLLEVGCGHGWPGFHVAQRRACDLVGSDIPLDALREAQANVGARQLGGHAVFVAADGRALPFRSAFFEATVHADTFC